MSIDKPILGYVHKACDSKLVDDKSVERFQQSYGKLIVKMSYSQACTSFFKKL